MGAWDSRGRGRQIRLRRREVVEGGIALAALGLAGCTSAPAAPTAGASATPIAGAMTPPAAGAPATATSPAAPPPKRGGTIRTSANIASPDSDFHARTTAAYLNAGMAYSGLMRFKHGPDVPLGSHIPSGDLAEAWEQPDDVTYIFKLYRGAKFQNIAPVNGRELTSADVLYSYQRVIDLKTWASLLAGVQRMETPDPYTFKITLKDPDADFLANLSTPNLVIAAKEAVEVNGNLSNGPHIGTGPWLIESIDSATGATFLARNPDYFRKGLPYADRLESYRIGDNASLLNAFRAKQLDVIASGVLPQDAEGIRKANPNDTKLLLIPLYLTSDELGFKVDRPPFDDARIRRAVVLALDRDQINETANAGFGILTSGVVTPDVSWQLAPETLKPLYKRDSAAARRLLAEAGRPNLEFELTVPTYRSQIYVTMAELAQAQLKEAGINATLKPLDAGAFSLVSNRGEFQAFLANAGSRVTANQDLLSRYHSKGAVARLQTGYNNPKLDALIDQQKVLSRDPAKRRAVLEEIQRTVIEDNVLVSISAGKSADLSWSYVKAFQIATSTPYSVGAWAETWLDK
jgi:ABC-type transport system substrate-binding protein